MKQYCRYCAFCFEGDGFRCSDRQSYLSKAQIIRENHCPDFALSEQGDVETGRQYKPRGKRLDQMELDLVKK